MLHEAWLSTPMMNASESKVVTQSRTRALVFDCLPQIASKSNGHADDVLSKIKGLGHNN